MESSDWSLPAAWPGNGPLGSGVTMMLWPLDLEALRGLVVACYVSALLQLTRSTPDSELAYRSGAAFLVRQVLQESNSATWT